MVGIEIPDIRLAQFFRPQIPDQEFCERYNHPQYDNLYIWFVVELGQLILKV